MGYRDPIRETGAAAQRELLAAAVMLGAHLDAPDGEVADEMLVQALDAFMHARECYLASLRVRYGTTFDTGPPSTHAPETVREVARRFGLTA